MLFILPCVTACGGVTAAGNDESGGASGGGGRSASGGTAVSGGSGFGAVGGVPPEPMGDTYLYAKRFVRDCNDDTQCVLVTEGEQCWYCPLCGENAAISVKEQGRWSLASSEKQLLCGGEQLCPAPPGKCLLTFPSCYAGQCGVRPSEFLSRNQFSQACDVDADCTVVPMGEICDSCGCTVAAIATSALDKYNDRIASRQCTPGPSMCDCIRSTETPRCVHSPDGPGATCELR